MFPVAHGWLLARLMATPTPAAYLGCVWPDMLFDSPLTHPQSHRSGAGLLAFARSLSAGVERDEFTAFARGVISHGSGPRGFDWFSDEAYGPAGAQARGYAFQRGAPLATRTATACGIAEEQGHWKAHNIVEMAFERSLFQADGQAAQSLAVACADTDLMVGLAEPLARFFGVDRAGLITSMRRYTELVTLTPHSLDALADAYALQTRLKHDGARPDTSALADLIGEAETLIADDRDDYLATCLSGVQATLAAQDL